MLKKNIIFLLTGVALLIGNNPIDYYSVYPILKLLICGIGLYGTYLNYLNKQTKWVWILGGIALMFNPFIIAHLVPEENERWTCEVWRVINFITGVMFTIYFIEVSKWGTAILGRLKVAVMKIFKSSAT